VKGVAAMTKKKILLVDDEAEIVKAVQIRLTQANYEVIVANDGQEALDKAYKEIPDLIILDLMLPKMDGHKVCGLLKANTQYNKIPIIIFTAKAQQEDMKISKEVGADAYVTKPFDSQKLLSQVEELLNGQVQESQ